MKVECMLDKVLEVCADKRYYRWANADGKVWLMPARRLKWAMHLYQPSGWKGKLLKHLFPRLHLVKPVRRLVRAEAVACDVSEALKALFCRVFRVSDVECSLFCGTPGVHQKLTVQLGCGGRILGYAKVTDRAEVFELFRREAALLGELRKKGLEDVPRSLYCKEWNGLYLFVQDTAKTQASRVLHRWTPLHERFLGDLHRVTRRKVQFEQSDYCAALEQLRARAGWLPGFVDKEFVIGMVDTVLSAQKGRVQEYSAYHADFTPWNTFVEKGRLFVFDWEYARMTYPPGMDRYHYFMQTAIFEKHWQAGEILSEIRSGNVKGLTLDGTTLYLLDVLSRFTARERGKVQGDVARSMRIWAEVLKGLRV